jgi:hypothetical protein
MGLLVHGSTTGRQQTRSEKQQRRIQYAGGFRCTNFDNEAQVIDGDDSGMSYRGCTRAIREKLLEEEEEGGVGSSRMEDIDVQLVRVEVQVVAGMMYLLYVKVRFPGVLDGCSYYKAKVWQQLPHYRDQSSDPNSGFEIQMLERIEERDVPGEEESEGGEEEELDDPGVDAAVSFGIQQLNMRNNSLVPYQLRSLVRATKTVGVEESRNTVVHHFTMVVGQGTMADQTVHMTVRATPGHGGHDVTKIEFEQT